MTSVQIEEIISHLNSLKEENDLGKKFRAKAEQVISILTSDVQLAVEKALIELEELNSMEMPSYHRTQVWDVISMLESVK